MAGCSRSRPAASLRVDSRGKCHAECSMLERALASDQDGYVPPSCRKSRAHAPAIGYHTKRASHRQCRLACRHGRWRLHWLLPAHHASIQLVHNSSSARDWARGAPDKAQGRRDQLYISSGSRDLPFVRHPARFACSRVRRSTLHVRVRAPALLEVGLERAHQNPCVIPVSSALDGRGGSPAVVAAGSDNHCKWCTRSTRT